MLSRHLHVANFHLSPFTFHLSVEMTRIGEQWYRFRLFAARNAIPLVWLWAGTMLCGLGTVYYRLKKGEKVTSELGRLASRD